MKRMFYVVALLVIVLPQQTLAFGWDDLWLRPDQQGAKLLSQGKAKVAANKFENPSWKGVANYRAGQYQKTVDALRKQENALSHYNRGNALAHLGKFQQAIEAYDVTLNLNPDDSDAEFNRDLLKKLLEQQKKQQNPKKDQNQKDANKQKDQSHQKKQPRQ